MVPHDVQTVVIARYLKRLAERTTVVVASGNHDLDGPGHHGEQVATWLRRLRQAGLHVDGSSVDVGDTRFTVCPWWDGTVTRDEVGIRLSRAAVDRPARWVWTYHVPTAGTPLCHDGRRTFPDRKSTRLNSSPSQISYAVYCLNKKKTTDLNVAGVVLPMIVFIRRPRTSTLFPYTTLFRSSPCAPGGTGR